MSEPGQVVFHLLLFFKNFLGVRFCIDRTKNARLSILFKARGIRHLLMTDTLFYELMLDKMG